MGRWDHQSPEARFWGHADRSGDGCWIWTATRMTKGYGHVWSFRRKRIMAAHRVAWEFAVGPIPDGVCVLHRCDNPPCVNPAHLFLGSNDDNVADKVRKNRQARHSSLTPADACRCRALLKAGITQSAVATTLGVSRRTVRDIGSGRTWRPST